MLASLSPEAASEIQERFCATLRGLGDRVEVRVPEKSMNELLRGALASGAQVVSVTPHRVSLESVFLSAVEESAAEGEAAGGAVAS